LKSMYKIIVPVFITVNGVGRTQLVPPTPEADVKFGVEIAVSAFDLDIPKVAQPAFPEGFVVHGDTRPRIFQLTLSPVRFRYVSHNPSDDLKSQSPPDLLGPASQPMDCWTSLCVT